MRLGALYEAAYRVGYDLVVVTLTRLPCVLVITAVVLIACLAYRLRAGSFGRGAWSFIFAVLALYGFSAAWAPAGWDEPLVLLGVTFAALAAYSWLDPARKGALAGAPKTSRRQGWYG